MQNPILDSVLTFWRQENYHGEIMSDEQIHSIPSPEGHHFGDPKELPSNAESWDKFLKQLKKEYGPVMLEYGVYTLPFIDYDEKDKTYKHRIEINKLSPIHQNLFHEAVLRQNSRRKRKNPILPESIMRERYSTNDYYSNHTFFTAEQIEEMRKEPNFGPRAVLEALAEACYNFDAKHSKFYRVKGAKNKIIVSNKHDHSYIFTFCNYDPVEMHDILREVTRGVRKKKLTHNYWPEEKLLQGPKKRKKNPIIEPSISIEFELIDGKTEEIIEVRPHLLLNEVKLEEALGTSFKELMSSEAKLLRYLSHHYGDVYSIEGLLIRFQQPPLHLQYGKNIDGKTFFKRAVIDLSHIDPIFAQEVLKYASQIKVKNNPVLEETIPIYYEWYDTEGNVIDFGSWGELSNKNFLSWSGAESIERITDSPVGFITYVLEGYDTLTEVRKNALVVENVSDVRKTKDGVAVKRRFVYDLSKLDPVFAAQVLHEAKRMLPRNNPVAPDGFRYTTRAERFLSRFSTMDLPEAMKTSLRLLAPCLDHLAGYELEPSYDWGPDSTLIAFGEVGDNAVGLRGSDVLQIMFAPNGEVTISPLDGYEELIALLDEDSDFMEHLGMEFRIYCEKELPAKLNAKWSL